MPLGCLTYEVRRPPRWDSFAVGMAINVAGIIALMVVAPRLTTWIPQANFAHTHSVTLVAPILPTATESTPPTRIPVAPQMAKLEAPRIAPPAVAPPRPPRPDIAPPKVAVLQTETTKVAASAPTIPPKRSPAMEIKTNVFGGEESQVATVIQPARKVQTGGFGDPNGIAVQGNPKRDTVTVAKLGSFDLPPGPGKGNGTAGSSGISGTVRSSGFGDGLAPHPQREKGYGGGIAESGFGTPVATSRFVSQPIPKKPEVQPVEILYKPRPEYTAEARRMRVEGEVLLEIVFGASGSLRVNRVVKGLGYGLDDTAQAAAQRIKFRPARRDGQPYDCAALVHMVFELAK